MRDTDGCKCSIRQISIQEYQKLKTEGIREQLSAPILNKKSSASVHNEIIFVPIKEVPEE